MKSFRRNAPEVNAGSMADIAFLLLIFFLVTTTISADKGILRQLPSDCPPGQICETEIPERNILRIQINRNQDIRVDDQDVKLSEIKNLAKNFIDNNGTDSCDYCQGLKDKTSSDHPTKAVISLQADPTSKYDLFIKVQDELTKAYYELRENYAQNKFNKSANALSKQDIKSIKLAYPFILSEAATKRN